MKSDPVWWCMNTCIQTFYNFSVTRIVRMIHAVWEYHKYVMVRRIMSADGEDIVLICVLFDWRVGDKFTQEERGGAFVCVDS